VVSCASPAGRYHELNRKIGDGGSHNTKLAARSTRGSKGRAFDHKQVLSRGNPYFYLVYSIYFSLLFEKKEKQKNKTFAFQ
jgi:hypothetical protein